MSTDLFKVSFVTKRFPISLPEFDIVTRIKSDDYITQIWAFVNTINMHMDQTRQEVKSPINLGIFFLT